MVERRSIARDEIENILVSAIYLKAALPGRVPAIAYYETMIFGGKYDQYQERCETLEGAMVMHQTALTLVKGS